MSPHEVSAPIGIVVTKTLTLILGGLITYYSYKAYRRTSAPELRALALGFGLMTVGAFVGGVIDLGTRALLGEEWLTTSVFVQSAITTVAFAVILYSLYVD